MFPNPQQLQKESLKVRFENFLTTLDGLENIDILLSGQPKISSDRADYLAENRKLVIELKALETDTEWKLEKILKPYRERKDFPIFFGTWELEKVLAALPEEKDLRQKIIDSLTTSIRSIFRKADNQVKYSKQLFNIPTAQGLLIVLNQNVEVLNPETVLLSLAHISSKRLENGELRYPNVHAVLFLSEVHGTTLPGNILGFPVLSAHLGAPDVFAYDNFLRFLSDSWAEYCGVNVVEETRKNITPRDLGFSRLSDLASSKRQEITNQEACIRYYERNPYFRRFSNDELLWYFRIIFVEFGRGRIKGASKQESERSQNFWLEIYIHFMEEVNHRGIDIRFFTSDEKAANELDNIMRSRFADFEPPERNWIEEWRQSSAKI